MVHIVMLMVLVMRVNGVMTGRMVTVSNNGQMVLAIRESTKKAKSVDKEYSNGQMDHTSKASSKKT